MKRSHGVEATVRRFLAARIAADVATIHSMYSESEYVRLIGSDQHEWSQGRDNVLRDWSKTYDEFLNIVDSKLLRFEALEEGDVGWAAVEDERTLASGQTIIFRLTFVLRREMSDWKVVQVHVSIPVADEEVLGVELTGTLSDLLMSIDHPPDSLTGGEAVLGTTTILFTDLVDSTALSQALGIRKWSELITTHFEVIESTVSREGGSVVKTLGDGGMYAFASATSALLAATAIQRTLTESANEGWEVRIGVHTGDVIQRRQDYLGITVNKAARVAAAAAGGQILASSATADVVHGTEFEFGVPITADLKGIEGTQILRPLIWD